MAALAKRVAFLKREAAQFPKMDSKSGQIPTEFTKLGIFEMKALAAEVYMSRQPPVKLELNEKRKRDLEEGNRRSNRAAAGSSATGSARGDGTSVLERNLDQILGQVDYYSSYDIKEQAVEAVLDIIEGYLLVDAELARPSHKHPVLLSHVSRSTCYASTRLKKKALDMTAFKDEELDASIRSPKRPHSPGPGTAKHPTTANCITKQSCTVKHGF
ncbi:Uu.00g043450.m01.CDS01 [Anthostomella pinea]|uniref:Uu.00g043450.m01.CDS01 n=1 Tax=Anthostomella pinea TaxID=933095 RepID=A0AAI8VBG6_9PEZI|nr:Uu.00g043450.m01.CDS01 [Anthostomella pinea]